MSEGLCLSEECVCWIVFLVGLITISSFRTLTNFSLTIGKSEYNSYIYKYLYVYLTVVPNKTYNLL